MGGSLSGGSVRILWDADDSAEVTITGGVSSWTVNGSAVTFPYTLSSSTTFETAHSGTYTVSVQHHGHEVANTPDGTREVELRFGEQAVFEPTVDDTGGGQWMADLHRELSATFARLGGVELKAGRTLLLAGDSNTAGTVGSPYRTMLSRMLGTAKVSIYNGGVSGDSSAELLARFDALLTTSNADAAFVMIGTNDLADGITLAQFKTNIAAIKTKCDQAGIPVVFGTIAPRNSGSEISADIHQRNMWLRLWCSINGVRLIDVYAALVDPTTGYLAAANDDGGGLHWTNAGHLAVATLLNSELADMFETPPWPVRGPAPGFGLLTNPLMAGALGAGRPTSWDAQFGSATTVADSKVAAAGDLPAGQWYKIVVDNTAGGGSVYAHRSATISATGYSPGDELLFAFYVKSDESDGAGIRIVMTNNNVAVSPDLFVAPGIGTPGPQFVTATVPASPGTMRFSVIPSAGAGQVESVYVGAVDVFNLTRAGLADMI